MREIKRLLFLSILFVACNQPPKEQPPLSETKTHLSPEVRYGALFDAVQLNEVFPDSKTFVDCTPKFSTDDILNKYQKARGKVDFDLKAFVNENFDLPISYSSNFKSDTSASAAQHINALWAVLTRQPDTASVGTLIPLPKPYIVPGGRFGEVYYWDSYFTILGLQAAERWDLIENMADNFSFLIESQGFVPNGNRTYYLSRSQPPFYSLIIRVLAEGKGEAVLKKYLPFLQKEYDFWMDGLQQLSDDTPAIKHVVRLQDGFVLNRYWDKSDQPRPESYKEDIALVKDLDRPAGVVYRHIRSAAESGWDFSSRWFKDGQYMASIHTTDIIPVDLNALLYHLELTLSEAYKIDGDLEQSILYNQKAENRKIALLNYCWNDDEGFFLDYDFIARDFTAVPSLAAMYPLYFNMAAQSQADSVALKIEKDFLKDGGVLTTLVETGQQWDAPNGWAPLQWITIKGLRNYGYNDLADTIKQRWVDLNVKVYKNTGKMVEKYNVTDISLEAGGGEYPVQNGFGWTNGVLLKLLIEDFKEE
jgi:alpha,alpha-trehalase